MAGIGAEFQMIFDRIKNQSNQSVSLLCLTFQIMEVKKQNVKILK